MNAMETFEELLKIAKQNKVDFILHAGDLYDTALAVVRGAVQRAGKI